VVHDPPKFCIKFLFTASDKLSLKAEQRKLKKKSDFSSAQSQWRKNRLLFYRRSHAHPEPVATAY